MFKFFCELYLILLIVLLNLSTINIVKGLGIITTNEKDKFPVETTNIEAIEGRTAVFSCPLIAPPSDKIYMVLWFRDDAGIPLYSIDARGKSLLQGQHWSDPKVFGTRANFVVNGDPAYLEIKEIKRHDQGVYRCRVDFKKSQTNSFKYNLTVIIPPEDPIVLDGWGRPLNSTTIGPKEEGDDVTLTCRVIGGRPQPDVRWLINGLLVDDQFEQNFGNVIENRLLTPSIKRGDLHSIFTCQAVNTHLMEPREKNFVLDMYLKPLTINITNTSLVLVAEQKYEVLCETTGSRPEALIMWFKGKKQLKKTKEYFINYKIKDNYYENKTISELSFTPTHDDDGVKLICRAENPKVNSFFIETSVSLEVQYPPVVNLQLGSTLSIDNINEGSDVYFECHIKSNPPWRKLDWLFNGQPIVHNTSAKVIRSNQSLVLQKVNRQSAGMYQCSAFNKEGETRSNKLILRVKFAPLCKTDKITVIGASKSESVILSCDVFTDPEVRKFRWKFENSEESIDITSDRYGFNGTNSLLNYTPMIEQDYGTISCWATNDVGQQIQPCIFQIILAGLPSPVKNCTWFNETQQSLVIQCQQGYDGGLPQIFILEIISMNDKTVRFNATNIDEAKFILNSLKFILLKSVKDQENDILKMFVYSMNQKGRSEGLLVKDFFIGNSNKYEPSNSGGISPILIGTVITFLILFITIIIKYYIKFKKKKKMELERYIKESKDSKCSLLNHHNNEIHHHNFNNSLNNSNNNSNNNNNKSTISQIGNQQNCDNFNINSNNRRNSKLLIDFDFTTDDEKEPDVISYPRFSKTGDTLHQTRSIKTHNGHHLEELIPMTSTSHLSNIVGGIGVTLNSTVTVGGNAVQLSSDCFELEKSNDLDVNLKSISDLLMSTRVPESCV